MRHSKTTCPRLLGALLLGLALLAAGCASTSSSYRPGSADSPTPRNPFEHAMAAAVACEQGQMAACAELGGLYLTGTAGVTDLELGRQLSSRACEAGVPLACYNLGVVYDDGIGITAQPSEAARFYSKACEALHLTACNNLGNLYQHGRGVPSEPVTSVKLWTRACEGGGRDSASQRGCGSRGCCVWCRWRSGTWPCLP